MMLRSMLSVIVLASSSLAFGCAGADEEPSPSSDVVLTGNVGGGGAGSTRTRSFGGVSTAGGNLHVVAHEVHARGVQGRTVDVAVASDGSFNVGVDRGRRWLITVDDAQGRSAIVTFGNGQNVLRVAADGAASRVDVGGLQIVGGEARTSIALDAKLGIEATLAGLDDVFEAANGAIIAAQDAVAQARLAAAEALKAADTARGAAEAARKAAEEAARAAGR